MLPSWCVPKHRDATHFGLAALLFVGGSTAVGHQDLGALMARQPAVAQHWREHLIASPFGTIHASVFSFPRPVGTLVPEPPGEDAQVVLASADASFTVGRRGSGEVEIAPASAMTVNRAAKGDLLRAVVGAQPEPASSEPDADTAPELRGSTAENEAIARLEDRQAAAQGEPTAPDASEASADAGDEQDARATTLFGAMQVFFDNEPIGPTPVAVQPWAPGEAPVLNVPTVRIAVAPAAPSTVPSGVTLADKGVVTGEGRRPKTPADYFGWSAKGRERAERCLANAVYFESRGEPVRGQIAVAQVVLNRAFSGYYPDDVCGVVYQNAHRHLACQFTFACDGIRDAINDADAWTRARRVARETLDGKLWLSEVGKSTHYHAYWVRPNWVRSMRKLTKIGVHTFYRPRKWGDGADAPAWGSAALTQEASARL